MCVLSPITEPALDELAGVGKAGDPNDDEQEGEDEAKGGSLGGLPEEGGGRVEERGLTLLVLWLGTGKAR